MNSPIRVLHVEDNRMEALLTRKLLENAGAGRYHIIQTDTLARAKIALEQSAFDIVLLDLFLPDGQGVDLLYAIQESAPRLPIIAVTGQEEEFGLQAMRAGAQACLIKSKFKPQTLFDSIDHAIEQKQAELTHPDS
jgi:DNA-binding NtrC family response regulator